VPKRHNIAENQSIQDDLYLDFYKAQLTTMPFSFNFHDPIGFQVARPTSAKIKEIAELIKELVIIKPNDNIMIFSSNPNYNLFEHAENLELAIKANNIQLSNETRQHFFNLVDLSMHDPGVPKTCTSSENITFLQKLIFKFKKIAESLNNTQIYESNYLYTDIGINTRLSNTKIKARIIRQFILEMFNIQVSYAAIYYTLKKKLKLYRRIGSTYIPWINSMRFKFCRYYFIMQYLDFIKRGYIPTSIDECGLQLDRVNRFVYVEQSSQHPKSHPLHARQWNLLLGICLDGLKTFEVRLGPTNQISFMVFLNEFLKSLKEEEKKTLKKHIIIIDNLGAHKTLKIKSLATKFDIPLLFIPTYSSCLNPVEYLFHFVKEVLNYSQTITWYFKHHKNT